MGKIFGVRICQKIDIIIIRSKKLFIMKRILYLICKFFIYKFSTLIVNLFYKDIWELREKEKNKHSHLKSLLYYGYLHNYGSWIGLGAEIKSKPILPHGLYGIFISHNAVIGKDVVIFHQVTIGSNSIIGSKNNGSPKIGDDVYIGSGAKIIGGIRVGDNVRIGANCIVVKNVPSNSVVVLRNTDIINKDGKLDNRFIPVNLGK